MAWDAGALHTQYFGGKPQLLVQSPGRVNLLGEHVDYNDGPVLPVAIDRRVYLAASLAEDQVIHLVAHDLGQEVRFTLDGLDRKVDVQGDPLPDWACYPAGVAWSLQEAGLEVRPIRAAYTSDLPIGAGLSSSAAVECAFGVAWRALGGWQVDNMALAQLCRRAENEYVGVASGLMDQFACLHGVAGHALYFDTRSLAWEALPLPGETVLVIADSGVRRELAGSQYNQRRQECRQAVEILKTYLPEIESLRDISPTEMAAYGEFLPPVIRRRAQHVVREIERVESAVNALKLGEWRSFGAKMFAGHASLRDLYEVSTPELDTLVDIARGLPGCIGARLTGAGFGGCTVNLVESERVEEFRSGLERAYTDKLGKEIRLYVCKASEGGKGFKV